MGELVWVELEHQGHLPGPTQELALLLCEAGDERRGILVEDRR